MLNKHRKWLALLPLCALASCQTTSSGTSSDTTALIVEATDGLREQFCRGQTPPALDTFTYTVGEETIVGVTPEQYDAAPDWSRAYILADVRQYRKQCPK